MSPVKKITDSIPSLDSWIGKTVLGITSISSSMLVWIALEFRADVNKKFDETNKRLSSLEIGQAEMSVKIDGNESLRASIEDIRNQVHQLERDMLLRHKNGPVE